MPTFIMLTERVGPGDIGFGSADMRAVQREARTTPWWIRQPAGPGAWSSVDIFEAPNLAAALLISTRISHISGLKTQLWPVQGAFDTNAAAMVSSVEGVRPSYLHAFWRPCVAWARKWTGLPARPAFKPALEQDAFW